MSAANNGGPAFPVSTGDVVDGHQDGHSTWQFPGMTLRDYFAAKALPAAMTTPWSAVGYHPANGLEDMQQHARLAYQMADAMLAERAK